MSYSTGAGDFSQLSVSDAACVFAIAFLAHLYGTALVGWRGRYYKQLLYILRTLAVVGAIRALAYFKWYRPGHQQARDVQKRRAS